MGMYKLTLNRKKCVNCGNCFYGLEEEIEYLYKYGFILISENNLADKAEKINYSLEHCYMDALTFEEYVVEEEECSNLETQVGQEETRVVLT